MFGDASETDLLNQYGILIGAEITRTTDGYLIGDITEATFSSDLASKLLVRISRATN